MMVEASCHCGRRNCRYLAGFQMPNTVLISDVFRSTGPPTVTYLERSSGKYGRMLMSPQKVKGQTTLLTGASKTGKTTLYKRVLSQIDVKPLVVRCDKELNATEFWRRALEQINFDQVRDHQQIQQVQS